MGQVMESKHLHILHSGHLSCEANQADFQMLTPDSHAADAMEGNTGLSPSPNNNVATSPCQHKVTLIAVF